MPINANGVYTSPTLEGMDSSVKQLFSKSNLEELERANGIYTESYVSNRWFSSFKRFGSIVPNIAITGSREYLFFTKPDLHLYDPSTKTLNTELSTNNFFVEANKRHASVMKQLQFSIARGGASTTTNGWDSACDLVSPFMNLLSNTVSNTLELPAISASVTETSGTIEGNKSFYRKTSIASDHDFEFSLEFEDSRDLNVYMLFKIYDEYERLKADGKVTPPDIGYILQKVLHDQFSIYKFIVDNDGSTILYWAKIIGVIPLNVPRDVFSDMSTNTNGLKLTINFKGTYVQDMEPIILAEFNKLVENVLPNNDTITLYDYDLGMVSGEWVNIPYITRDKEYDEGNPRCYHLRWR